MRRVLVTRAEPGASETAARLNAMGLLPLVAPALSIAPFAPEVGWSPQDGERVIFTSANGVRAYVEAGFPVSVDAMCVGPATTSAAEDAGFRKIWNADGNSDTLVEKITSEFELDNGAWVHYANDAAAGDVCRRLNEAGYTARFVPLYGARPTQRPASLEQLQAGDVILLHSAKAADAVRGWLGETPVETGELMLVAVSERAAEPLKHLQWHCVSCASGPNEEKLLEALQIALKSGLSSD